MHYPEKKGYSARSLTYMCQFARTYPLEILQRVVAQYALTGYAQPIGVSDYQLSKAIPENLKSALPSIEEVEEELSQLLDNKKDEK